MYVCISFWGSRVTFLTKNAFMERDPRVIQKSTREPPTPRGSGVTAPSSFTFQWKVHGRVDPKTRFLAIFGTFQLWCIFEGGSQGHPKTHAGPPSELWYPRYGCPKFQFHWKTWGISKQKSQFPQFLICRPLKAQIDLRGHLIGLFLCSGFTRMCLNPDTF